MLYERRFDLKQQLNTAALYCRLSRDDGGDAESNSIITQKMMLQKYAKDNGFAIFDEYVDDGISGTTFERAGFQRMIADIEADKVGVVLCKDLSRLGRNNALVAYYTEIHFVEHDVRFIALNDGIDTLAGDNEIMPFKSVINEYYARDISKKIRSSFKTKAQHGQFLGTYPPLGYIKSPEDKHKLIVDEAGAKLVKRIFEMCISGMNCYNIAITLREDGIPTIREHFHSIGLFQPNGYRPQHPPKWQSSSVRHLLQNQVYLGCVVNGKASSKSYKHKKRVELPEEQWVVVPNCHEPIISEETFELAQVALGRRQRKTYQKHYNMFGGFIKCADCGATMSIGRPGADRGGDCFICNKYRIRDSKDGHLCTSHYISYKKINEATLLEIRRQAAGAKEHEDDLRNYAETLSKASGEKAQAQARKELDKLKKRCAELDTVIARLFEQNALGVVSDERFVTLSGTYEGEQNALKAKIAETQAELESSQSLTDNMMQFLDIIRRYVDVPELDRGMLTEVIDKILVHEATCRGPNRKQKLEFHFRLVGSIGQE